MSDVTGGLLSGLVCIGVIVLIAAWWWYASVDHD